MKVFLTIFGNVTEYVRQWNRFLVYVYTRPILMSTIKHHKTKSTSVADS
jgi:hypothetical protein